MFVVTYSFAQKFNGYVITDQNVIIKGELKMLKDAQGRKISINDGKSYFIRTFYILDLKSYAYKKDTFMILNAFHPFEGNDYLAEGVEAKVLISKGKLKLYYGKLPEYRTSVSAMPAPGGGFTGVVQKTSESIYIIHDNESLYGVSGGDNFIKSVSVPLGDDAALMKRIKNKELKYKDIVEIITLYNANASIR